MAVVIALANPGLEFVFFTHINVILENFANVNFSLKDISAGFLWDPEGTTCIRKNVR